MELHILLRRKRLVSQNLSFSYMKCFSLVVLQDNGDVKVLLERGKNRLFFPKDRFSKKALHTVLFLFFYEKFEKNFSFYFKFKCLIKNLSFGK